MSKHCTSCLVTREYPFFQPQVATTNESKLLQTCSICREKGRRSQKRSREASDLAPPKLPLFDFPPAIFPPANLPSHLPVSRLPLFADFPSHLLSTRRPPPGLLSLNLLPPDLLPFDFSPSDFSTPDFSPPDFSPPNIPRLDRLLPDHLPLDLLSELQKPNVPLLTPHVLLPGPFPCSNAHKHRVALAKLDANTIITGRRPREDGDINEPTLKRRRQIHEEKNPSQSIYQTELCPRCGILKLHEAFKMQKNGTRTKCCLECLAVCVPSYLGLQ